MHTLPAKPLLIALAIAAFSCAVASAAEPRAMYTGRPLVPAASRMGNPVRHAEPAAYSEPPQYSEPAPAYLILRTPKMNAIDKSRGWYPADPYRVTTQAYAYGWFGAEPRMHWTRHFGYYQTYTEWSGR